MNFLKIATLPGHVGSAQYWLVQFIGWTAMAVVSYFSLTIWYNPGDINAAIHTFLQAYIGMLISYPLGRVASRTWEMPITQRVLYNGIAFLFAALAWTVLRIITFTWTTGEPIGSDDWGGWIFASVTVMGAWSFLYHGVRYYRQWLNERQITLVAQRRALEAQALAQQETLRRLEAEGLFKDAQLRMLKYQFNPHFLFNALNSVACLVEKKKTDEASSMITGIADYLRASLDQRDDLCHPLRDEIELVEHYVKIEKVRFRDRLNVIFDVSGDAASVEVPAYILQPIFENSIKFGVGRQLKTTTIRLTADISGDQVRIRISDDGPAQSDEGADKAQSSSGIGLENVRARLQSAYGDNYEMTVKTMVPHGFAVTISLPLLAP